MEIKEFIKNVLQDIEKATAEASNENYKYILANRDGKGVFFDLAVTVSNSKQSGKEGKAGIKVAGVIETGGSLNNTSNTILENTTRIQFNVGYRDLVRERECQNIALHR